MMNTEGYRTHAVSATPEENRTRKEKRQKRDLLHTCVKNIFSADQFIRRPARRIDAQRQHPDRHYHKRTAAQNDTYSTEKLPPFFPYLLYSSITLHHSGFFPQTRPLFSHTVPPNRENSPAFVKKTTNQHPSITCSPEFAMRKHYTDRRNRPC